MATPSLEVEVTHFPPGPWSSDTDEIRAIGHHLDLHRKGARFGVATGDVRYHALLAEQATGAQRVLTGFPEKFPYEAGLFIAHETPGEPTTVILATTGTHEKSRYTEAQAYSIIETAAAGLVIAVRRARLRQTEPDPTMELIEVIPDNVETFRAEVAAGSINLTEEVGHGAITHAPSSVTRRGLPRWKDVIGSTGFDWRSRVQRDPFGPDDPIA